jgi:hypothetical protein
MLTTVAAETKMEGEEKKAVLEEHGFFGRKVLRIRGCVSPVVAYE